MMDRTLKSLSLALSYPSRMLKEAMPDISAALMSDARLTDRTRRGLSQLTAELGGDDLYALEERYVALFDRSRTLSLNLFEHVHGESRDRGGAMVSLLETYRRGGLEPVTMELPDHLPVLLEFLATRPGDEARDVLADAAHILEALRVRLERRDSAYAAVPAALVELSGAAADKYASTVAQLLEEPEADPDDLGALDAVWEESEVHFGPGADSDCPQARDMLARMHGADSARDGG